MAIKIQCTIENGIPLIRYEHMGTSHKHRINVKSQDLVRHVERIVENEVHDLMMIGRFIYGVDKAIKREWFFDRWHRQLRVEINVLCPSKWNQLSDYLSKMLNFLTGDEWTFHFIKYKREAETDDILDVFSENYAVSLFSGGLDSYIGAIDLLKETSNKLKLLGHTTPGKATAQPQKKLVDHLIEDCHFNNEDYHKFSISTGDKGNNETTTRSRSFLFIAHGIGLASCSKKTKVLYIPENGFVSLNVPLTHSRLGSGSTKSTHPHYINMFKEMLEKLEVNVDILLPYMFKTKSEMINHCKDTALLQKSIKDTVSCSGASRIVNVNISNCGHCWPCLVRRVAIKESKLVDYTVYDKDDFNKIEYTMFVNDAKKSNPLFKIHESGKLTENIEEHARVFSKSVDEVSNVLMKHSSLKV